MIRAAVLSVISIAIASAANAKPFSVRCADDKAPFPYFATFDLETNRMIFERPSGGLYRGVMRSTNDDEIEFTIKGDGGRIDLTFKRQQMRMLWAGLGADWLRPVLSHSCATVSTRTPLSLYDDRNYVANSAQLFSLKCVDLGQVYFFSFDLQSKRAVLESLSGQPYPGSIQAENEQHIDFIIDTVPKSELRWNEHEKVVTWKGVPGDSVRPTKANRCDKIKTRTVLDLTVR
ncbi:hypothetical protein MXD81_33725 [Microbacteriaceae bacterium K1510]|nr:hypothetical protein [Microbacteriaceae bacterium K1510]